MLAWLIVLITDAKTRNHGYDVIVGGELFTDYSDRSSQTFVTLNPKLNQCALDATSFFPAGGCHCVSAGFEDFLRKSGRCGIGRLQWRHHD